MIDTKELQIGNWISFSGANRKIAGIFGTPGEFMMLDTYWPSVGYKESTLSFRTVYAEPIPLTREILEKNGFEEFDSWLIYNQEETGIEISWLGTILKISGECGNLELPAIMYVHQLQNVLSICGIEKEIIL